MARGRHAKRSVRHPSSAAGRVQAALARRGVTSADSTGSSSVGHRTISRPGSGARWSWAIRLAIASGTLVLVAGVAAVVVLALGRPKVSVTSSGPTLIRVHVGGLGTQLSALQATSAGRSVPLAHDAGGLVPAARLGQDQTVRVTATAKSPTWLRWLVGPSVSATKTVRTPAAKPSAHIVLASELGQVPVTFDHPVSVIDYRSGGGASHVVHLSHPTTVADLAVPGQAAAGYLTVAAAPLPWETVASRPSTVTWFVAPATGGPVALADPAPGSATASTSGRITLTFDETVAKAIGSTRPTLSPAASGAWSEPGADTLVFTPSGFGFGPGASVTVTFDRPVQVVGGSDAPATTTAAATSSYQFDVAPASTLRLEQILAQLNYLPLSFVPAAGVTIPHTFAGEVATISTPLAGSFSWRWASTPATLQAQWVPGSPNLMLKGALMAFDATQGNYDGYQQDDESVAQLANLSTWQALLQAAADNQVDPNPYAYVYVTKAIPETLTLWENGSVVLTSAANTGIAERPTADGTFPIYVRYTVNYMSGTNPDGSTYHDLVHWINYFNGGDAVHGFVRGYYGYPQSLGCVELPVSTAEVAFSDLAIGDLVTVAG
jgi:hypothetical protein